MVRRAISSSCAACACAAYLSMCQFPLTAPSLTSVSSSPPVERRSDNSRLLLGGSICNDLVVFLLNIGSGEAGGPIEARREGGFVTVGRPSFLLTAHRGQHWPTRGPPPTAVPYLGCLNCRTASVFQTSPAPSRPWMWRNNSQPSSGGQPSKVRASARSERVGGLTGSAAHPARQRAGLGAEYLLAVAPGA